MVATATFRDVVEKRRKVEEPGALEACHQLAAERVLMCMLGFGEPTQIAHHHQDVLIDGVDMKQIVLHPSHDSAKDRQIAPEHRPLVHSSQFMRDGIVALQNPQECGPVFGVAAKARVDSATFAPDRPKRAGAHAAQFAVAFHGQECAQDCRRLAGEEGVVGDVEQSPIVLELVVDRLGDAGVFREQLGFEVLQQQGAELGDRLGDPVIALHQLLAGDPGIGRVKALGLRDLSLEVEHQPVFTAIRDDVQPGPYDLEPTFIVGEQSCFPRGHQSALGHARPGQPKPSRA